MIDTRPESFCVDFFNESGEAVTKLGYQSIQWILNEAVYPELHDTENPAQTMHDYYYRLPPRRRMSYMSLATSLAPDEKVYGLGERFGPFMKTGRLLSRPMPMRGQALQVVSPRYLALV